MKLNGSKILTNKMKKNCSLKQKMRLYRPLFFTIQKLRNMKKNKSHA